MTIVLLIGGLAFGVGLLVLRPFAAAGPPRAAGQVGGRSRDQAAGPAADRQRELLRQLRDLDDDLAAGKLSAGDHERLRWPVERAAAAVLTSPAKASPAKASTAKASTVKAKARAAGDGAAKGPAVAMAVAVPAAPPPDSGGARATGRWRRRSAILLILAWAAAGVTIMLEHAVAPRTAGETISGTAVPGVAPAAGGGTSGQAGAASQASTGSQAGAGGQGSTNGAGGPASPAPSPGAPPGRKPPTRQQLMAVAEAEAVVTQNPRSVTAHLALASAYVSAGASQLAAVEWLAVTQLDPGNPEANTDLALLAFEVGRARQARTMVDRALATDPKYPEGLYVRGLIDLMGLRQPAAAVRDLNAYLTAAPYGSHRTAAVTLIALAQAQGHP
jgi:tetratricopeptide repeat protein